MKVYIFGGYVNGQYVVISATTDRDYDYEFYHDISNVTNIMVDTFENGEHIDNEKIAS